MSTFDKVADIISETSEIPREEITTESHTIDDLGIDSLDFLDIVFAIDKEFGIKIPMEAWTEEVNNGTASTEDYFVMKNLCTRIDELGRRQGLIQPGDPNPTIDAHFQGGRCILNIFKWSTGSRLLISQLDS